MLSDARNLWKAMQMLNENITTALEGFDDGTEDHEREPEAVERDELDIYKKMLDDAQMQHYELSKQSRLLLAEKDAELTLWKQKYAEATGQPVDGDSVAIALDSLKLMAEKKALEENLLRAEESLRQSLGERNEALVKMQRFDELSVNYTHLKAEYEQAQLSWQIKHAQKNDTIDNLVAEYSKLAAEAESRQNTSSLHTKELEQNNEILAMKMHALEHSITELADRASSSSNNNNNNNNSSNSTSNGDVVDIIELKETKARLVNLQFDLKEKEGEIAKLKRVLVDQTIAQTLSGGSGGGGGGGSNSTSTPPYPPSSPSPNGKTTESTPNKSTTSSSLSTPQSQSQSQSQTRIQEEQQLDSLRRDVQRLQSEKRELEDAGKEYFQQNKVLLRELEALKASLATAEATAETATAALAAATTAAAATETNQVSEPESSVSTEEMDMLREMLGNARSRLREAESRILSEAEGFSTSLTELQTRLTQSETVGTDLRRKVELLTLELATMTTKAAEAQQSASLSLVQEAELCDLRLRLQQKELELSEKGVTSTNSEAVADGLRTEIRQLMAQLEKMKMEMERMKVDTERMDVEMREREVVHATALERAVQDTRREGEAKMEQAVAAAVATTLTQEKSKTVVALESLRDELTRQFSDKEQALLQRAATDGDQAVAIERSRGDSLRAAALQEQKEKLQAALAESLQSQEQTLRQEAATVLATANNAAATRLRESLETERSKAKAEAEAVGRLTESRIHDLQENIKSLQDSIKSLEMSFEERLKSSVSAAESKIRSENEIVLQRVQKEAQALVQRAETERDEYKELFTKENKTRKALHNKIMDLQGNIRVFCRVRPIVEIERRSGEGVDITEFPSEEDIVIHKDAASKARFEFDRVFPPGTSQETVFDAVKPTCLSVLDGYNVCVFAYGQTGSGKTYTMEGYGEEKGVSPRAVSELFDLIANMTGEWSYQVTFSMLEIYNETIRDLLDNSKDKDKDRLDVRQTAEGNMVPGLIEVQVFNPSQVMELMAQGQGNRAAGSHNMNEHSSRSHSILTLACRGRCLVDGATAIATGKLHLIDLAGSERVGKTDATGDRLKEAQSINKSLSALGDVINALGTKKSQHIPYRNSKLTFLLQESLGGNSKVMMFVNISPAVYNMSESICSLNFASRCRNVELGQAKKNEKRVTTGAGSSSSLSSMGAPPDSPSSSSTKTLTSGIAASSSSTGTGGVKTSQRTVPSSSLSLSKK